MYVTIASISTMRNKHANVMIKVNRVMVKVDMRLMKEFGVFEWMCAYKNELMRRKYMTLLISTSFCMKWS